MKYLTHCFVVLALLTSLQAMAAYQTKGFHTTCATSEAVAKFFAKPKAVAQAESAARQKCRDISLVAHHFGIKSSCKAPYPNNRSKNIFSHICVDCEAEASFDCH